MSDALTNVTTSAGVTAENNRNMQPSAVAARTSETLSSKKTVQVRRADICRWRWMPTAKQLIEGPPKASGLRLLNGGTCGPEGSTLLAKQFEVLSLLNVPHNHSRQIDVRQWSSLTSNFL